MEERLKNLRAMITILLRESYGDQYSVADFCDINDNAQAQMDELALESDFYQRSIKKIDILLCEEHNEDPISTINDEIQ